MESDQLVSYILSESLELHQQLHSSDSKNRQRGRVVFASVSQSGGPGFESRSGHLLDLFSVVPSSNPRSRL